MNMKKIKWIWIKFWGNRYRVIKNDELLKEIVIYDHRIYIIKDYTERED